MTTLTKKVKKLAKLKNAIEDLDWLRDTIIKVIEQGGDIDFEWRNTGLFNQHDVDGFVKTVDNGSQTFTFRIPPHNIKL